MSASVAAGSRFARSRIPPRATSMRYGHRIYDRSVAGLGTGKAQRCFASDFDRPSDRVFDAGETGAVEVEVGAAPAARYSDAVLDGRRSGVRSIARIICRPRNRLDGRKNRKVNENNMLAPRFCVAPMMDWNGTSNPSILYAELRFSAISYPQL